MENSKNHIYMSAVGNSHTTCCVWRKKAEMYSEKGRTQEAKAEIKNKVLTRECWPPEKWQGVAADQCCESEAMSCCGWRGKQTPNHARAHVQEREWYDKSQSDKFKSVENDQLQERELNLFLTELKNIKFVHDNEHYVVFQHMDTLHHICISWLFVFLRSLLLPSMASVPFISILRRQRQTDHWVLGQAGL